MFTITPHTRIREWVSPEEEDCYETGYTKNYYEDLNRKEEENTMNTTNNLTDTADDIIDIFEDLLDRLNITLPDKWREGDYKTKATNAEKKFLAQLIGAGLWAIRDGGEFYSVANALEYMFVYWNSASKGRHLNSYLTFYCPLARLCGRGQKVEL